MPLEELQAEAKRVGITDREIGKCDEDAASQDALVDKILQREEEQVCRKRPRREVPTLPLRPARGPRPSRGASGRPRAQNRFFLCWACCSVRPSEFGGCVAGKRVAPPAAEAIDLCDD